MPGKLGIGLYNSPAPASDVINSGATVCLLYQPAMLSLAAQVKQAAPNITIIGRKWIDDTQVQWVNDPNRRSIAGAFAAALCTQYPAVDVWQYTNELPSQPNFDQLRNQVDAEQGFTDACVHYGKRSVVLNWSVGSYPVPGSWSDSPNFPTVAQIVAPLLSYPGVAFFGLHAYGCEGQNLMNSPNANACSLRHRLFLQGLGSMGISAPPVVFTEYGQETGWRSSLTEEQMFADISWWGLQITADGPAVYGAAIFSDGNSGGFANFDIDGTSIPGRIAAWNGAVPGPLPAPQPPPTPLWGVIPWWAVIGAVTAAGLAAMIVAEPGVSEAGPPTPGMPSGRGLRYILEGEPVPVGYTVIGEWREE